VDSLGRWALPVQQATINAGDISLHNALRESLEGLPALVACFSNACRNAARLPVAVPVVPPPASRNVAWFPEVVAVPTVVAWAPIGLVELRRCVA
jgi:hypothetical protein